MDEDLTDWMQRVRSDSMERLEAIRDMQQRIAEVVGTATAAQGRVRVRVTPAGMPTSLEIDDDIDLDGGDIAEAVMTAIAEATAGAAARLRAAVGEVLPAESLEAMLRGGVSDGDVQDVQAQIRALRGVS